MTDKWQRRAEREHARKRMVFWSTVGPIVMVTIMVATMVPTGILLYRGGFSAWAVTGTVLVIPVVLSFVGYLREAYWIDRFTEASLEWLESLEDE